MHFPFCGRKDSLTESLSRCFSALSFGWTLLNWFSPSPSHIKQDHCGCSCPVFSGNWTKTDSKNLKLHINLGRPRSEKMFQTPHIFRSPGVLPQIFWGDFHRFLDLGDGPDFYRHRGILIVSMVFWMGWCGCVWKCCVPLNPMVTVMIIIPIKWL